MPSTYYPAQIEQLKRKAKLSARSLHVPHSTALDQVAREEGFANWSLLMRHNHDVVPHRFARTEDEWKLALRSIDGVEPRLPETYGARYETIHAKFLSPYNAVSFAAEYMHSLLLRPRYRIHHRSLVYMQMRWWLPYGVHDTEDDSGTRILLNRYYKPVGYGVNEFVRYADFANLHVRLGFEQLKLFSNHGRATGYMFDDGNPPWSSRANATAYLGRLQRLCRVLTETPDADALSAWTETRQAIFEALAPWARIGTWYTPHPADELRLQAVLAPLKQIAKSAFSDTDLRAALLAHRGQNVEILGGKATDATLDRFVQRIMRLVRGS
jgi:hypothetical protein